MGLCPAIIFANIVALKVYRHKARRGEIERVVDARNCIVRGLFKRETNWDIFTGLIVTLANSTSAVGAEPLFIRGMVEGNFGMSGKCRVRLYGMLNFEMNYLHVLKYVALNSVIALKIPSWY